jgi:hypothetical protein
MKTSSAILELFHTFLVHGTLFIRDPQARVFMAATNLLLCLLRHYMNIFYVSKMMTGFC